MRVNIFVFHFRRKKKGAAKDKKKKSISEPPKSKRLSSATGVKKTSSRESPAVFNNMKLPFEVKSSRLTRSQKTVTSGYRNTNTSRYFDNSSGLFLYVDMHGHATKRGNFYLMVFINESLMN
jgi:hypothetical protein